MKKDAKKLSTSRFVGKCRRCHFFPSTFPNQILCISSQEVFFVASIQCLDLSVEEIDIVI